MEVEKHKKKASQKLRLFKKGRKQTKNEIKKKMKTTITDMITLQGIDN